MLAAMRMIRLAALPVLSLLLLAGCNPFVSAPVGARYFAQDCAACHGAGGRGGEGGPDLTGLATREGGYPRRAVLNRLDGYGRGFIDSDAAVMPDMGHLMTGRLIEADLGRGARRALPERIVALNNYLERIQR